MMDHSAFLPVGDYVSRAALGWNASLEGLSSLWLIIPVLALVATFASSLVRGSRSKDAGEAEGDAAKPIAGTFDASMCNAGTPKCTDAILENAEDTDNDPGPQGWFPLFACCVAPRNTDVADFPGELRSARKSPSDLPAAVSGGWSVAEVIAAGVPQDKAAIVSDFAYRVHACRPEPLADPTTLWRFLSAREWDADAAEAMYLESMAWRASFSIRSAMELHGSGEQYDAAGRRVSSDLSTWAWRRGTSSPQAQFMQRHGFWGKLTHCTAEADEAPIAIWRVGAADLAGYVREDVSDALAMAFASHLEDLLQSGRAASRRRKHLVRARVVLDASGLGLSTMRYLGKFKGMMGLGKLYFPEVSASITIVRAPLAFTTIYRAIQPLLTPVMRRKVCILGEDFKAGLRDHAGLDPDCLPAFLGGKAPSTDICEAAPLPAGARRLLKQH